MLAEVFYHTHNFVSSCNFNRSTIILTDKLNIEMKNQKKWLITGVSKGLGREIANIVHKNGDKVIGVVRKGEDKKRLEDELLGITIYILDLEQSDRFESVIVDVIKNEGRIDVLVNNAGYGMFGLFEEISVQELRKQFEINVFSKWSLINAVLPQMRKQQSGVIIQISSRLGILAGIGNSAYSSAEFAIEGMSESLAEEVKPFGIQVMLVEPGPMRTSFFGSSINFANKEIIEYQNFFKNLRSNFKDKDGKQKGDPTKIAEIIYEQVNQKQIPFRLPITAVIIDALRLKSECYKKLVECWSDKAKSVDTL